MINFKQVIAANIDQAVAELTREEISGLIEVPPNPDLGDYALPCFQLAQKLRKAPEDIANNLKNHLEADEYLAKLETEGAYLNFFVDKIVLATTVLEEVITAGEEFGSANLGESENIVIDFSSPNIAKPFHVGHLRSTVIGNSLYKIYEFLGYNCIGINHLGDWGTQFGKVITAYKKWGTKANLKKKPITTLLNLYVKFHQQAKTNPELETEARNWFKKLEEGEEEANRLWKWFVDLSLQEFKRIYKLLDIEFDHYTGESFYNNQMEETIQLLKDKKLLTESEGALVVDIEDDDLPPCMILKSDGATTYATRDITAAIYRNRKYDFEQALYVTDYSQELHFVQWMKVIELMDYDWANQLEHISFGRVSSKEGKLQTREGDVILLEDLIAQAVSKVKRKITEKNPELENKEEVAHQVGVGAIIFNDLSNYRIKDIVFDWERMLNFEGETGPYIQYVHARINSILRKSDCEPTLDLDYSLLTDKEAVAVIKAIYDFPDTIIKAMNKNEPSIISKSLLNLAKKFNKFYHNYPIIVDNKKVQQARLTLILAVKIVIKIGLNLLGIKAPEKM